MTPMQDDLEDGSNFLKLIPSMETDRTNEAKDAEDASHFEALPFNKAFIQCDKSDKVHGDIYTQSVCHTIIRQ
jgi:hypothetical protein